MEEALDHEGGAEHAFDKDKEGSGRPPRRRNRGKKDAGEPVCEGAQVELQGLEDTFAKYNGLKGKVTGFNKKAKKWEIVAPDGTEVLMPAKFLKVLSTQHDVALVEYVNGVKARKWSLQLGEVYKVGRFGCGAEIGLEHPSLSRHHCSIAITLDEGDLVACVLDPGSTNGTFVDNKRLEVGQGLKRNLCDLRHLAFGESPNGYKFIVCDPEAEAAPPAPRNIHKVDVEAALDAAAKFARAGRSGAETASGGVRTDMKAQERSNRVATGKPRSGEAQDLTRADARPQEARRVEDLTLPDAKPRDRSKTVATSGNQRPIEAQDLTPKTVGEALGRPILIDDRDLPLKRLPLFEDEAKTETRKKAKKSWRAADAASFAFKGASATGKVDQDAKDIEWPEEWK